MYRFPILYCNLSKYIDVVILNMYYLLHTQTLFNSMNQEKEVRNSSKRSQRYSISDLIRTYKYLKKLKFSSQLQKAQLSIKLYRSVSTDCSSLNSTMDTVTEF